MRNDLPHCNDDKTIVVPTFCADDRFERGGGERERGERLCMSKVL